MTEGALQADGPSPIPGDCTRWKGEPSPPSCLLTLTWPPHTLRELLINKVGFRGYREGEERRARSGDGGEQDKADLPNQEFLRKNITAKYYTDAKTCFTFKEFSHHLQQSLFQDLLKLHTHTHTTQTVLEGLKDLKRI